MRLTKIALLALRGLSAEAKQRLADNLEVDRSTVYLWIKNNDDNLTKAAALKFIREETGLTDEQILETEKVS